MSKKVRSKATSPAVPNRGKNTFTIVAKNDGQKQMLKSLYENTLTIVDAPAGVGKTHIGAMYGLNQLLKGTFQKMVISRPVLQAGQNLGFLPGTIDQKIAPYIAPIMNIYGEKAQKQMIQNLLNNQQIIFVPFAMMRGHTWNNSFVLLDQLQNCSAAMARLAISRIGQNSKMFACGDVYQSDRTWQSDNGLKYTIRALSHVPDVSIVRLGTQYIMRSQFVKNIEQAFQLQQSKKQQILEQDLHTDETQNTQQVLGKNPDRGSMPDGSVPSRDSLWT